MVPILLFLIFLVISCLSQEIHHEHDHEHTFREPGILGSTKFISVAESFDPITDKVVKHKYQINYGRYLMPKLEAFRRNPTWKFKMLEIGLGCNMDYGPGASVRIWKNIAPKNSELWEGEYDVACVEKSRAGGKLEGINVVTGDQGNATDVARWVRETGGNFDVIIDDGGHTTDQIMTSFVGLWPHVNPGGMYFIEDIDSCHHLPSNGSLSAPNSDCGDIIIGWMYTLLLEARRNRWPVFKPVKPNDYVGRNDKYPLPPGIESITCQLNMCLFIKCVNEINCSS